MNPYQITYSKSAFSELEKLDPPFVERIFNRISDLAKNPRPKGAIRLKGTSRKLWRLRVGDYRVIYEVSDSRHVIDIAAIRHRSEAYR